MDILISSLVRLECELETMPSLYGWVALNANRFWHSIGIHLIEECCLLHDWFLVCSTLLDIVIE